MNGYITDQRFATTYGVPIQLSQTELRRGRFLVAGQVQLFLGQTMRVRSFNLHLINILTTNVVPSLLSTPIGVVSAGIFLGKMLTSGAVLMRTSSPGVITLNPFQYRDFSTPGVYYFVVSNNAVNVDVTVALTGVASIFNG